MKAIIKFLNGEYLEVEENGNSYILDTKPVFPQNLSTVTITNEETTITLHNVELVECASIDDRYWFNFTEIPEVEVRERSLRADLEYLAAMADIEI